MKILSLASVAAVMTAALCASCASNTPKPAAPAVEPNETTAQVAEAPKQAKAPKERTLEFNKTYTLTIQNAGYKFLCYGGKFQDEPLPYIQKMPGATLILDITFYNDHTTKVVVAQKVAHPKKADGPRNFRTTLSAINISGTLDFVTYSQFGETAKSVSISGTGQVEPITFYTDASHTQVESTMDYCSTGVTTDFDWEYNFTQSPALHIAEDFTVYGDVASLLKRSNPLGKLVEK